MENQTINSFEAACEKQGIDPKVLPGTEALPAEYQKRLVNHYKKMVIVDALNDGWKPDWSDRSQRKYWPYMKFVPGVGWSYHVFGRTYTLSSVGSRFVFKDWETAAYAAQTFPELFSDEPGE